MRRAVIGMLLLAMSVALPLATMAGIATAAGGDKAIDFRGEATGGERTVRFRGEEVRVPAGWPVIRLAEQPHACVRLDRRAVYLGTPSAAQRCPAGAVGRRQAIVVNPASAAARAGIGDEGNRRVERAGTSSKPPAPGQARASGAPVARVSAGSDFTGLGVDACAAPSRRSMRAWDSSPYRAIGVYIGGLNRACSQPNLTASWVAEQVGADWHLIPTYVGLQAPTSSCSTCAKLSAGSATFQGTAEANDAVEQAAAIGMGPGSPLYFDMESYSRTSSSTNATLTFLQAWTARLHTLGYESGVYSSGASGIADLVDRLGSGYLHPDHIWIANWDGRRTADDPYVPDDAWAEHQRIRQYRGGHDETWGGVTINVDNNYVEGGTVGSATGPGDDPKGTLDFVGSPSAGQVQVVGWAFDPSAPGTPVSIRVYVGGKPGRSGAIGHELGAIATQVRPEMATRFRASGGLGGFDVSFPTTKVGREQVCAYAVNIGTGSDKPLGCRTVGVRIPISVLRVVPGPRAVRLAVRCEWPAETACPGQIALRARTRIRLAGPRGRVRTRVVPVALTRRPFRLAGGTSRSLRLPLNRRGIELLRERGELRAKLIVAVPDGRLARSLTLRAR